MTLGVLILLVGCSTTGQLMPGVPISLDADTGVVVFSLTHDRGKSTVTRGGSGLIFRLNAVEWATGERFEWVLDSSSLSPFIETEGIEGGVFVIRLNPGYHELIGFNKRVERTPWKPVGFDVKPGQVLYLGNIHLGLTWKTGTYDMPVGGGVLIPRSIWMIDKVDAKVSDRSERDSPLVEEGYQGLKGRIGKQLLPAGPWPTMATSQ